MNENVDLLNALDLLKKHKSIAICFPTQAPVDVIAAALALSEGLNKIGKKASANSEEAPIQDVVLRNIDAVQPRIVAEGNTLIVSVPYEDGGVDKVSYTVDGEKLNIHIQPENGKPRLDPQDVEYTYTGGKPDCIVTLYIPGLESLGTVYKNDTAMFEGVDIINIDRHLSSGTFGTINYIDKDAPAMSQIMFEIIQKLGAEIDVDMATNLLAGIMNSTRNLTAHNVTDKTKAIVEQLKALGAEEIDPMPNKPKLPTGAGAFPGMPGLGGNLGGGGSFGAGSQGSGMPDLASLQAALGGGNQGGFDQFEDFIEDIQPVNSTNTPMQNMDTQPHFQQNPNSQSQPYFNSPQQYEQFLSLLGQQMPQQMPQQMSHMPQMAQQPIPTQQMPEMQQMPPQQMPQMPQMPPQQMPSKIQQEMPTQPTQPQMGQFIAPQQPIQEPIPQQAQQPIPQQPIPQQPIPQQPIPQPTQQPNQPVQEKYTQQVPVQTQQQDQAKQDTPDDWLKPKIFTGSGGMTR